MQPTAVQESSADPGQFPIYGVRWLTYSSICMPAVFLLAHAQLDLSCWVSFMAPAIVLLSAFPKSSFKPGAAPPLLALAWAKSREERTATPSEVILTTPLCSIFFYTMKPLEVLPLSIVAVRSETLGQYQSMLVMRKMCGLDEERRPFSQSLTMAQNSIENVSKRLFYFLLEKSCIFISCSKTV